MMLLKTLTQKFVVFSQDAQPVILQDCQTIFSVAMASYMMKKTTLSLMMTLSLLGVEPAFASNAVLTAPVATTSSLGGFTALWTGNRLQIKSGSRVIWESVAAESFLRAGTQQLDAHELRGHLPPPKISSANVPIKLSPRLPKVPRK